MMRVVPRCLLSILVISITGTALLIYLSVSHNTTFNLLRVRSSLRHTDTNPDVAHDSDSLDAASDSEIVRDGYIVSTVQCQIPYVDMWHSSVLPYVQRDTPSLNCDQSPSKPDLTFVQGDMLMVNDTNLQHYDPLDFCEYVEIIRPKEGDYSFDLGRKRYVFTNRITIKKEFIKVYCYSTNNILIYHNLHATTPTKPAMKHLKDNLYMRHKRRGYLEHLNVLMVGVDSVSRLNFHRQFPKTGNMLKERLGAYEMFGYNKVRDNTFINLVPMFLGKYVEETGWNETSTAEFDKHQYAWKRYAACGYHTLFAEDAPEIAIWNFEKPGFMYSPADYYLRPFSLAMAADDKMWQNNNHCFGEKLETDITLDYIRKFISTRQGAPYFAFTFLTRPTYDSVNQNTDNSHASFLNTLIENKKLENTMVIYFSDHGARRGDILSTYIGKLEERLPAMFIALPLWFKRKYPQVAHNLEINQHRLTTPFDINALLDDVLRFDGQPNQNIPTDRRSISLFDKIPYERNCKLATIDDHWCTCLEKVVIRPNGTQVEAASHAVISHINNITSPHRDKCVEYKLQKILDAMKSVPNHKLITFKQSINDVIGRREYYGEEATGKITMYHVTVQVAPSSGVYQATVKYDTTNKSYTVSGDISRTSLYGNASWCVNNHTLKKYCYCRTQVEY